MHPKMKEIIEDLQVFWVTCLQKARSDVMRKTQQRAPQYEQNTPIWIRLSDYKEYLVLIKIKNDRIQSELASTPFEDWDPDNLVDLIAWATFLLAFKHFMSPKKEGNDDQQSESK